mmetsp:Transcript_66990/g.160502  ORF Transcript_66990/g.160502 Transcript_66990/m.160502 type:complete len:218 (+) Transcript_66990:1274-1927(+)
MPIRLACRHDLHQIGGRLQNAPRRLNGMDSLHSNTRLHKLCLRIFRSAQTSDLLVPLSPDHQSQRCHQTGVDRQHFRPQHGLRQDHLLSPEGPGCLLDTQTQLSHHQIGDLRQRMPLAMAHRRLTQSHLRPWHSHRMVHHTCLQASLTHHRMAGLLTRSLASHQALHRPQRTRRLQEDIRGLLHQCRTWAHLRQEHRGHHHHTCPCQDIQRTGLRHT